MELLCYIIDTVVSVENTGRYFFLYMCVGIPTKRHFNSQDFTEKRGRNKTDSKRLHPLRSFKTRPGLIDLSRTRYISRSNYRTVTDE